MYILDTNVVSELRKAKAGKANHRVIAWSSSVPAGSLYISAITVLELEMGVLQIERRDRAQGSVIRAWLDEHVMPAFAGRILAVDAQVALRCARLHVPNRVAERDALIAATALVHGMTVVTRNVADFAPTKIALIDPWNEPTAQAKGKTSPLTCDL
jgi:predicted nucleic acid-binding protein